MNIVHVCRLFAPHIGGVETHVEQVSAVQRKRGASLTIVTTQHDVSLPLQELRSDGIKVLRLPLQFAENKLQTWWWVAQHASIFRQADIIQVHDIFWWLFPVFSLNRTKIITTFHGWETVWPIPVKSKVLRQFFNQLSAATVHVGGWIRQYYGDVPDQVTYGGVNARFLKIPAPKFLLKKKPLRLLFIGRLEIDTAVSQYCELVKMLRKNGRTVEMTWVGDGSLRAECEQVGTVVGWQKNTEKWLRDSDIVCASSYLSMLQAQAAGRQVICLYANELKRSYLESYIGSQYCIIAGNIEDATKTLEKLLRKPEQLQAMQTGAKAFAATQTWENVTDMYEELTKKKLGQG